MEGRGLAFGIRGRPGQAFGHGAHARFDLNIPSFGRT